MVGGYVIETVLKNNGKVWVNCKSKHDYDQTCAIYVPDSEKARSISPGDTIWWQGPSVYWTPKETYDPDGPNTGPGDIELERASFSGVSRPSEEDIVEVLCQMPKKHAK